MDYSRHSPFESLLAVGPVPLVLLLCTLIVWVLFLIRRGLRTCPSDELFSSTDIILFLSASALVAVDVLYVFSNGAFFVFYGGGVDAEQALRGPLEHALMLSVLGLGFLILALLACGIQWAIRGVRRRRLARLASSLSQF